MPLLLYSVEISFFLGIVILFHCSSHPGLGSRLSPELVFSNSCKHIRHLLRELEEQEEI
jgi:hypothetical protein